MTQLKLVHIVATTGAPERVSSRKKKVFPGAFISWFRGGDGQLIEANGYGIVTDANYLYAAASVCVLDHLATEGVIDPGGEKFAVRFVCKGAGIDATVKGLTQRWASQRGKNYRHHRVENYGGWERLGEFASMGLVSYSHPSSGDAFAHEIYHSLATRLLGRVAAIESDALPYLNVSVKV